MGPFWLTLTDNGARRLMLDALASFSYEELINALRIDDYRRPDVAARLNLEMRWYHAHCSPVSRRRLIRGYYPLALHVACMSTVKKYVDPIELASVATPALMDAIDRFDPSRGNRFSTFASHRLLGAMMDHARAQDNASRLTRRRSNDLATKIDLFAAEHGRQPSDVETATMVGPAAWRDRQNLPREHVSLSVGMEPEGQDNPLADVLPAQPDRHVEHADDREQIETLITAAGLRRRERQVIGLFAAGHSRSEIANMLGTTPQTVATHRSNALHKMRQAAIGGPVHA
jgi:RNA polymerase sigma factor (sigma-70 family)